MDLRSLFSISGRQLTGQGFTRTRGARHEDVDLIALRKRRAKNKAARRSRRVNRLRVGR